MPSSEGQEVEPWAAVAGEVLRWAPILTGHKAEYLLSHIAVQCPMLVRGQLPSPIMGVSA